MIEYKNNENDHNARIGHKHFCRALRPCSVCIAGSSIISLAPSITDKDWLMADNGHVSFLCGQASLNHTSFYPFQ